MDTSIFLPIAVDGLIEQLFTRKCPTDFLNHLAWLDKYRIESQVTDVPIAIVLHMTRLARRKENKGECKDLYKNGPFQRNPSLLPDAIAANRPLGAVTPR
ncbi:MAG TPA: hypothetical protein VGL94_17065 [Ktedonobacteraceae bacterium]|jgi:hypothetical protein